MVLLRSPSLGAWVCPLTHLFLHFPVGLTLPRDRTPVHTMPPVLNLPPSRSHAPPVPLTLTHFSEPLTPCPTSLLKPSSCANCHLEKEDTHFPTFRPYSLPSWHTNICRAPAMPSWLMYVHSITQTPSSTCRSSATYSHTFFGFFSPE